MKPRKCIAALAAAVLLALAPAGPAMAAEAAFSYRLSLTDQSGAEVYDPRSLRAGDTLYAELELARTDTDATSCEVCGLELRLSSLGLDYNGDGASFRAGTAVTRQRFLSGDSVGFAYFDMDRIGERIANPAVVGQWSYTVTDPSAVNLTVPVAVLYTPDSAEAVGPVGNARLFLDPGGGALVGEDVSGDYPSGTAVTLPEAVFAGYTFEGWSDGARLYDAGGETYTVTGVVTLTARWADLVRDRQVLFEPNGGEITGPDPGGLYADGETVLLPGAVRPGFVLAGWTLGGEEFAPGSEYVVDNSVIFFASWTEASTLPGDETPAAPGSGRAGWAAAGAALGLAAVLLPLLRRRRYVRYSLTTGDIRLSHRERGRRFAVEVFLSRDGEEYALGKSGLLAPGERLTFLPGAYALLLDEGSYHGRLHVTYADGARARDLPCRIKAAKQRLRN